MHPKTLITAIATLCATASQASAAEESPSAHISYGGEPRFQMLPSPRWYGAQPVVTDILAMGSFILSIATLRQCFGVGSYSGLSSPNEACDNDTSGWFAMAAIGLYGLGGPVAHATHDHLDKAALSLGMRATPFIIATLGGDSGGNASGLILVFGTFAAMVVDDVILANDEVRREPTWSFAPAFDPVARSGSMALVHAF